MLRPANGFRLSAIFLAALASLWTAGCGGSDTDPLLPVPAEPAGLGIADTAEPPAGVLAYVDTGASNQRGNPCMSTLDTNAGVRVLSGFLDIWAPSTLLVDAGQTAAAANGCPAVARSTWTGLPGDPSDGSVRNSAVHAANIDYVKAATRGLSTERALLAYLDDRRGKGYSMGDGMGPLTSLWRAGTGQTTTIVAVNPNALATRDDERGNNLGDKLSSPLARAVTFIDNGNIVDGSVEPAKRFFKYARPYRWSTDVRVIPALESAKSTTPDTDGGFPSGHTAEAWRDALPMAYLFPQRFQELLTRAAEMGDSRIVVGMHSPLDVMGGRIQATAVVAYSLNKTTMDKAATFNLVQNHLMSQTGTQDFNALLARARTPVTSDPSNPNFDRFSDYSSNKALFNNALTYNLPRIAANDGKPATVPKGAEVLLETRLPYLSAAQRRVVLKTTSIDSGFPLANDSEGWGRLNLFAAADGFGAFNGDVTVTMNAAQGGFHARDVWRNNIAGAGKLTKLGTGALRLSGSNTFSGGTVLAAGTLAAESTSALGNGDVFMKGGTLEVASPGALVVQSAYTQTAGTLKLVMSSATNGVVRVARNAVIDGGGLEIGFSGFSPSVGDSFTVMSAGRLSGNFSSVSVAGFSRVTTTYSGNSVNVRLDAR